MAKTMTQDKSSSAQEAKKQRKKQAKQEAKLMLKVEEAKKSAQKAESKVARAQAALQEANNKLHAVEEQLTKHRGNSHQDNQEPQAQNEQTSVEPPAELVAQMPLSTPMSYNNGGQNGLNTDAKEQTMEQQDQADLTPEPTNQIPAQQPAEGRTDISQESATADTNMSANSDADQQSSANADQGQEDALQVESDDASIPVLSNNPEAWPPPETRQEIAQGAIDEVQHPHSSSAHEAALGGASTTGSDAAQAGPEQTQLEQRYGEQSE